MSTSTKTIMAAAGNASGPILLSEAFSVDLYTGNGSTKTITNDVDLSGEGGLVWIKGRSSGKQHILMDTERGTTKFLSSENNDNEVTNVNLLTAFNSDGFTIGNDNKVNQNTQNYASWTFRKAPKFFDVVTYTGNRDAGTPTAIPHNLGSVPGCIIVKKTTGTANWIVYHRNDGTTSKQGWLNLTNAFGNNGASFFTTTAPTDTNFYVGTDGDINENGQTYVAYLFAHNDGDGEFGEDADQDIIKCGSYVGNGLDNGPFINLGWTPQFYFFRKYDSPASFHIYDSARGLGGVGTNKPYFLANSDGEDQDSDRFYTTSTGIKISNSNDTWNEPNKNFIYIAIRAE